MLLKGTNGHILFFFKFPYFDAYRIVVPSRAILSRQPSLKPIQASSSAFAGGLYGVPPCRSAKILSEQQRADRTTQASDSVKHVSPSARP